MIALYQKPSMNWEKLYLLGYKGASKSQGYFNNENQSIGILSTGSVNSLTSTPTNQPSAGTMKI